MTYHELGWRPFFSDQITQTQKSHFYIGRIANVQKGTYLVYSEQGEFRAKLAGSYTHRLSNRSELPVVGDWVYFSHQPGDSTAIIQSRFKRQNRIARAAAGFNDENSKSVKEEQVIAANIDLVFIVSGLDRDFNLRRIERYLGLVYDSGSAPVIILNKADLCADPESTKQLVESVAIGTPVHFTSIQNESDNEVFQQYLTAGKTAVLLGSSGVGKSTIINRLLGQSRQTVRAVSAHINKGTHTTTTRELIILPDGGLIVDTPGMRELQLFINEQGLEKTFDDIEDLALNCRFSDCRHGNEPGCAVNQAIEDGIIEPDRLNSYLKLKKEVNFLASRETKGFKIIEREKFRKIKLMQRQMKKQRFK